jgi:xanthine/uracil/vitamin C permease (AzgA family)
MTFAELKVDAIILACAVSAGIHGALVPDHFKEGAGAGIGFVIATVALAGSAVALTRNPSQPVLLTTSALFAGLIMSYAAVLVTGLPVLHPEREAVDGLALFTKAVEAAGLLLAASLVRRPSLIPDLHPEGTLT